MSAPTRPPVQVGAAAAVPESGAEAGRITPEEQALIERLIAGDDAAFATLVDEHHDALVRMAKVFVRDAATAEEVVQDTWMAVLNGLSTFERRSSLKTWIFRILANRAKTRGVRESRSVPMSALGGDEAGGDEPAVPPDRFGANGMWSEPPRAWQESGADEILARKEAMGVLESALAGLPPGQRAVVTLCDIEGLTPEETRNVLEITETNRRVLLHRARSKLRRALEQVLGKE